MAAVDKKTVVSLSFAHLINDWYMNYIQVLLPFLVASGLSLTKGSFLISAFTITASITQPVLGYFTDQKDQRWFVYVGTLWMAILICLIGVVGNYPGMFALAVLAGLGTAAFHPQAAAMVTAASGDQKGFSQAVFVAAGNLGWAITPVTAVPFIEAFGLSWTPVFMALGIVAALLILVSQRKPDAPRRAFDRTTLSRESFNELAKIVLVVAIRSLSYFGLVAFLPLYLQSRGMSLAAGSLLISVMLVAGAIGGLAGGHLSDRFGRKPVVAISLLLATPLFLLFLVAASPWTYVLLALAGASLMASFSVTIVVAQEVIGRASAMASGLMMGFAVGIGGLGVGVVGFAADRVGLAAVIQLLVCLPVVAGIMCFRLRTESVPARTVAPGTAN
jgi:MFS transporter, FSR family, fosmidomycin resistance protein